MSPIGFDKRLAAQDIAGSVGARADARGRGSRSARPTAPRSCAGSSRSGPRSKAGSFVFRTELEDIHLNIEARLTELIGEPGRRLHTARSRNDQVATDFKLWVRDAVDRADGLLAACSSVLLDLADAARRVR